MPTTQGSPVLRFAAATLGLALVTGCATGPRIALPARSGAPLVYPTAETTTTAAPQLTALQITSTVAECVTDMQRHVREMPGPTALAFCGCLVDSSLALWNEYGSPKSIPEAALHRANEGCADYALSTTVKVAR